MKTKMSKSTVAGALLAILLVGAGYAVTQSYVAFNEQTRAAEQSSAICDRMFQAESLNEVQLEAENDGASQSLDKLVTANIQRIKSQLTSSDAEARTLAQAVLKHMAHRHSQVGSMSAVLSANH